MGHMRTWKLQLRRCSSHGESVGFSAGDAMWKYGHMRVRGLLEREVFPAAMRAAPLAWQFSSLGSIGADWVDELRDSFSRGAFRTAGMPIPVYVRTLYLYHDTYFPPCVFLPYSHPPDVRDDAGELPCIPILHYRVKVVNVAWTFSACRQLHL